MNANRNQIVPGATRAHEKSTRPAWSLGPSVVYAGQRVWVALLALGLFASLNLIPAGRATAQTFTILRSFGVLTNVTGFNPQSTLVQGPDGTLYGTATYGEGSVEGTLFKVQPDGSGFTVLKWFTNSIDG